MSRAIQVASGKYYVAVAMIRNVTTAQCAIGIQGVQGAFVTSKEYTPAFLRFTKTQVVTGESTRVGLMAQGAAGNTARMDNLRVYEISKAEYDALATMTTEQVSEKYPFGLIGIRGVDGPYVIGTADNLLPPFYAWGNEDYGGGKSIVHGPYMVEQRYKDPSNRARMSTKIPVIPGQTYTLSYEIAKDPPNVPDSLFFYWMDADQVRLPGQDVGDRNYQGEHTAPANAFYMEMLIIDDDYGTGSLWKTQKVANPMLTAGPESQSFKPQRKSMLAFQTELHANPSDSSDPDLLFEQNGQNFKLAKWKKVVLDGYLPWVYSSSFNGFKEVRLPITNFVSGSGYCTKYNGEDLLNRSGGVADPTGPDQFNLYSNGNLYLSISNMDSGWGPDYTPTQDEIKAYFFGWVMYDGTTNNATPDNPANNFYNGTGTKAWTRRTDGVTRLWSDWTGTLPTNQAPNWTPYQLLYRLAKETVEPVVSEGELTLAEGDNIVEVGTGIVMRERANPFRGTNGNVVINSTYTGTNESGIREDSSKLKFKVDRILHAYKNSQSDDFSWTVQEYEYSYGNQRLFDTEGKRYDPSAAYSVTYLKLDKSPIQPITGTLAANEKAQISDLTAGVAEALQRISAVEMKKAEKDASGWIMPTLLNGWVNYDGLRYSDAGFMKDSIGYVHLRGMISGGAMNPGVVIFKLPEGYRPKKHVMIGAVCSDGEIPYPALVNVSPNGDVSLTRIGYNRFLSLYLPPFSAEQ